MAGILDHFFKGGSISPFNNQAILGTGNLNLSNTLQSYLPLTNISPLSIDSLPGLANFRSSFNASVSDNSLTIEVPQSVSMATSPLSLRFKINSDGSLSLNSQEFLPVRIFTDNLLSMYLDGSSLMGDTGNIGGIVVGKIDNNQIMNGDSGNNSIAIIGANNVINANSGNDNVAAVGNGNTLNGEGDNDILAAVGNNNVLNGGLGDDVLKATGVNNILNGGAGHDIFGLPDLNNFPFNTNAQGPSLVQDFEIGVDKLGLPTITTLNGTSSTSRVLNFNELTMTQQGQDTSISYQGNVLAIVKNIQTTQINATDFIKLSDLNLSTLA